MTENPRATRDDWLVQVHALTVLHAFVTACDREGIDVLPVKGILSARTLYADVAERTITDVDVRVRPRDVRRVARLARERGWPVLDSSRAYGMVVVEIDGVCVDVEDHVGAPATCSLTVDAMLGRASRDERTFGFSALVADPHDHALLLMANAFKDHLSQAMAWSIEDLSRLARAPWLDVPTLLSRARDADMSTLVWLVADWMADAMANDAWADVRARMGRPARAGFVSMHQWLESLGPRGWFALRVLARFVSDDAQRYPSAGARLALWKVERWASLLTDTPYRPGRNSPPVLVRPRARSR